MKYLLAFVFVLCSHFSQAEVNIGAENGNAVPVKKYTVDLDKPPEERWLSIMPIYRSSVPLIIDYVNSEGHPIEMKVLRELLSNLTGYFGEYGVEMKSIADALGIDIGIIVTLNLSYDLRRLGGPRINTTGNVSLSAPKFQSGIACTSILALNKSGTVFHGRTLDWQMPVNLRNLTIQVDYMKGGEIIFTADSIVGVVGVSSGVSKQGGFSISINERSLGGKIYENGIHALLRKSKCPILWARQVLTSATSFEESVQMLQTEPLIAPVYYITAGSGPNEGAVITRNRDNCRDLWLLNTGTGGNNTQDWYLLETNYDHWKQPEPYDNRRGYGLTYLNELGQDKAATAEGLMSVLAKWPIRNNYTSSSAFMVPGEFHMESYIIYP